MFNLNILKQLIDIDTTSGKEENLIPLLKQYFETANFSLQSVDHNRHNLLATWGIPKILFCTHLDTVTPHFPFKKTGNHTFNGRGACDAKGQIFSQITACHDLLKKGYYNFGWLGVVGEETTSDGAKIANEYLPDTKVIIIGEPTDNYLISATKGTFLVDFIFNGIATHSGYPKVDAINNYLTWAQKLKSISFPYDNLLGETTYIFSQLCTNNPINVVANQCRGKVFFRTTFSTHNVLDKLLPNKLNKSDQLHLYPMSIPLKLKTFSELPTKTASFTSDASYFTKIPNKILFGPGSILDAHTLNEKITKLELETGINYLIKLFEIIQRENLC